MPPLGAGLSRHCWRGTPPCAHLQRARGNGQSIDPQGDVALVVRVVVRSCNNTPIFNTIKPQSLLQLVSRCAAPVRERNLACPPVRPFSSVVHTRVSRVVHMLSMFLLYMPFYIHARQRELPGPPNQPTTLRLVRP